MSKGPKLVPEIRFPDHRHEDGWDIIELGLLSEIVRGGSPRPIEDYFTTDESGLNWLKIADVSPDAKYIFNTKEKVKKEALSSTREVNSGDLILSNSMSFGRPYILKITTCIHDGWIAIKKISAKTFEDYLYYFISSESSQTYFKINAAGAAVKNLNAEIIKLLPIHLPKSVKEQKKIAECLSSLDDVIAAHRQRLDLLKEHKKGLMQNLFPQEGEKIPKYRFKEFEKDGEWVESKLDKHIEVVSGFAFSSLFFSEKGSKLITPKNFTKTGKAKFETGNTKFTTEKYDPKYLCKPGDLLLLLTDLTPTCELLGKALILQKEDGEVLLNQRIIRIEIKSRLDKNFLLQFFLSNQFHERVLSTASGTTVRHSSNKIILDTSLLIPDNPKEQKKIADCLVYLDLAIDKVSSKIEELNLHKKGLMQGLFPKINK